MSYWKQTEVFFPHSNLSPFGDLITNELTPVVQADAIYGLLNQLVSTSTAGTGATVDTNGSRFRIQSGTSATTGSAILNSVKTAKYRPGQGLIARFTTVFDTGATGNRQFIGVDGQTNGYGFGYNPTDGEFGICHRNAGSDTWVKQSDWNGDKCDGTGASGFNWTKTYGNVCMISYPFLGYGNINFFVEDSNTGRMILCHSIKYANSTATIQLSIPTLHFHAESSNPGANTTNKTIYVGSFGVFLYGKREYLGSQFAYDNRKTGITTETNIFSLKNCTTFNGISNEGLIRLRSMSVSFDGANGQAIFRIRKGATIGGTPSFSTISGSTADGGTTITSGQSVASVDVAGTTATGGTLYYNTTMSRNSSFEIDLTDYDIYLIHGEILTLSAQGYVSGDASVCLNWQEE